MKNFLFLCSIFTFIMLTTNALAVPSLPTDKTSVFEFNNWEYVVTHDERDFDPTDPQALQVGDYFEGVFDLDSITDGQQSIYDPDSDQAEITAFFTGMQITNITEIDSDDDGFPNRIDVNYDFTEDAYIEVYFDDTPNLTAALQTDRATAIGAATDGQPLLKLNWGEFRSSANTADSAGTADDVTGLDGHVNIDETADPSTWIWNDLFLRDQYEFTAGSGNFYDFLYQADVFAPPHPNYLDNADYFTTNGDRIWDFYSTDDFRGKAVPEPGTLILLGTGLLGLAAFSRKKFKF